MDEHACDAGSVDPLKEVRGLPARATLLLALLSPAQETLDLVIAVGP